MGTQNLDLTIPAYNTSNWNTPINNNFSVIDAAFGNTLNIAVSGSSYVLKKSELANLRINVSGSIGANDINVIFPDGVGGSWIVTNATAATGGSLVIRTASYTVSPITIPPAGSVFVYSDGRNLFSAVSGSTGNYLPITGGVIEGNLGVNRVLTAGETAIFQKGLTVNNGLTTVGDLRVTGAFSFNNTNLSVETLRVFGAAITGSEKLAVAGPSKFGGDVNLATGNVVLDTGGIRIKGLGATSSLLGQTEFPATSSLIIRNGATFAVEGGANVSISGEFRPASVTTGDITSNTKISCTGLGGVNTGPGGLTTPTQAGVTCGGNATVAGTLAVSGKATFAGGVDFGSGLPSLQVTGETTTGSLKATGTISTNGFIQCFDLDIDSRRNPAGGYATARWSAQGSPNAVHTLTNDGFFIMANEQDFAKQASLNLATGRFTATGGVGVQVSSLPVGADKIASLRGAVYADNGIAAVDLGAVVGHLIEEIHSLRAEVEALKAR